MILQKENLWNKITHAELDVGDDVEVEKELGKCFNSWIYMSLLIMG